MPRLHLAGLLFTALPLAPAAAQAAIVHAAFDNFVYDNGVSMGGPNLLLAIKTQMPVTTIATRVEIWTGEQAGPNSIAIWSHDPAGNRPLAVLASGTWSMGRVNGWQGAYLTTPLPLNAGQDVWVVWGPINNAQSSVHGTGAGAQPYRGSFNGGATWNGPYQSLQWKFRIWTGTPGHYEVYGTGCPGVRGLPDLAWFGMPMAGGSFQIQLDRAVPGNFALLSFGESDTNSGGQQLPYSLAPFGAPLCSVLASLLVTVLQATDPMTGQAVFTMTLPNNPSLVGFRFYNQWFCLDAAANQLGLTVSNAGAATVGL